MKTEEAIRAESVYKRVRVGIPEGVESGRLTQSKGLKTYIAREITGENRFKWLALAMIVESVIITPLTALAIMVFGNYTLAWFLCTAAMYTTFVPGLSGFPTKTIINTFIVSLVADLAIITGVVVVYLFSQ